MKPDPSSGHLASLGLVVAGLGLLVFAVGVRPDLVRVDFTPGIGLLQITVLLAGIALMTLGGFAYLYAVRHRGRPSSLRADIGVRLMATGLVVAIAAGYADVLGIGSHSELPSLGPLQALAVAICVLVIGVGCFLYSLP